MAEYIDDWTEEQLKELEEQLHELYQYAEMDLDEILDEYFAVFKKRFAKQYAAYQDGKYTLEQFREWEMAQIGRGERWEALRDDMAKRITTVNVQSADMINESNYGIYAENYNWSAYLIEDVSRRYGKSYKSISFNIMDANTVKRLSRSKELTMLPPKAAIKIKKDEEWNKKKFQNAILGSILRGEDIQKMAGRLSSEVGHMNEVQAIRAARTACTEAQNAGRNQNYLEAEELGIEMEKEWIATNDDRVRESHAHLDGVRVKVKENFPNGLEYPGDHRGAPAEVYNCRCTMRSVFPKYESGKNKRTKNNKENYKKWKNQHNMNDEGGQKYYPLNILKLNKKSFSILIEQNTEKQMKMIQELVGEYLKGESTWSGKVKVDEEMDELAEFDLNTKDIVINKDTSIKSKIHEMVHSYTIFSGANRNRTNGNIKLEEAITELIAEKICYDNGLPYKRTYVKLVDTFKQVAQDLNQADIKLAIMLYDIKQKERYSTLQTLVEYGKTDTKDKNIVDRLEDNLKILTGGMKR